MKKLVFAAMMLLTLCMNNSNAQVKVVREGKTFKQVNKGRSHKADTLVTGFTYEYNGIKYPVVINKSTGSCYIWKTSKKGRLYKQYMIPEISQQICKELNIEYKPKNRK